MYDGENWHRYVRIFARESKGKRDAVKQTSGFESLLDALKQSGMDRSIDETLRQNGFNNVREMLSSISPFDISCGILNMNILTGVVLAVPTALFGRTRRR